MVFDIAEIARNRLNGFVYGDGILREVGRIQGKDGQRGEFRKQDENKHCKKNTLFHFSAPVNL